MWQLPKNMVKVPTLQLVFFARYSKIFAPAYAFAGDALKASCERKNIVAWRIHLLFSFRLYTQY